MEKFLYNINSTSWFYTLKNGKVVKLEVFLLLMSAATFLGAIGVGYEGVNDIDFGTFYIVMLLPFLILITQYLVYSLFFKPTLAIIESFWKTLFWRLRDPSFAYQKIEMYPNWQFKLKELEQKWLEHYGETADETLSNAPWIQKYRFVILLGSGFSGLLLGIWIG